MKIVEISASLGNGLKRYNAFVKVSMSEQPFTKQVMVLYGVTKPTDIVQTNTPTNILIDEDGNPIGDSQPVYFGIRVYPFISELQQISCNNNSISYGELFGLAKQSYFVDPSNWSPTTLLPNPYTGQLYPQPEFVETLGSSQSYTINYKQAMQQFLNDCVFPTKPNLDIPGQTFSSNYYTEYPTIYANLPYFNTDVCVLSKLNQKSPTGVLNRIQDKETDDKYEYKKYMVQFDGQKLNFKFGMSVNSDFATFFTQPPNIYLPFLYRTYGALITNERGMGTIVDMGVIMQCLLYDSNGKVISA